MGSQIETDVLRKVETAEVNELCVGDRQFIKWGGLSLIVFNLFWN